jgi:membrane-associated protease RseP (regulator of RpoE activity)
MLLNPVLALGLLIVSGGLIQSGDDAKPVQDEGQRIEVRVEQTVTTEKDGDDEKPAKVSGKIVVVGPDGKTKEYKLNDELPEGVRVLINDDDEDGGGKSKGVFVFDSNEFVAKERLMIGVHCDAADGVLRSQLKLGEAGLVVLEVIDESPAKESGIQQGDVIFQANGSELTEVEQLVELVQKSEGKGIEFGIVRGGDRSEITVTPRKMKADMHVVLGELDSEDLDLEIEDDALEWVEKIEGLNLPADALDALKNRRAGVTIRSLQPGIVIDREMDLEAVRKLVAEVRERAQAEAKTAIEANRRAVIAHEQAAEAQKRAGKARVMLKRHVEATSIEEIHAQMKELQEQMAALQKALEKLKKQED